MRFTRGVLPALVMLAFAAACVDVPPGATTTTTSASTTTSMPGSGSASAPLRQVLNGGITCDGVSFGGSDGADVGSVSLDRSGDSMDVTVTVTSGIPDATFSVEAFEIPCAASSDTYATGHLIPTDGAGNGSITFSVPFPYVTGSGTLGDDIGSENLAVVLDIGLSQCGCGDTYVARVAAPT